MVLQAEVDNKVPFISMLKKNGISHVVSFDDEWDSKDEPPKQILEMDALEYLETMGENIDIEQIEPIMLEHDINSVQEVLDSLLEDLGELKSIINKHVGTKRDKKELEILENLFKEIQEEDIQFSKFSKKFECDDVRNIDGRILFLLDMNMEDLGEGKDVIIETLIEINKVRRNTLDIAIVYSHEVLTSYKDHTSKIQYLEANLTGYTEIQNETEKYLLAHQLWAIPKVKSQEALVEQLNSILTNAILGHTLYKYLNRKVNIMSTTIMELIKFSDNEFDLLLKDALIEGESLLNVLQRIQFSLLNKNEFNSKTSDTIYIQAIENLLDIFNSKTQGIINDFKEIDKIDKIRTQSRKQKLEEASYKNLSEYGLIDYSINTTYEDLQTGDIFNLKLHNDEQQYYGVLITANCDIPIRFGKKFTEGTQRNEEYMSLLLYTPIEIEQAKKDLINDTANKYIWPVIERGNSDMFIALKPSEKVIHVHSNLLDTCTLNKEGKACLDYKKEEFEKYKSYNYILHFESVLKDWVTDIFNVSHYTNNPTLVEDMNGKSKQYLELLSGYKYLVSLDISTKEFKMERIGRMSSNHSLKIIQNYANKISRLGVESIPFTQ
ncbi:hypothetical protein [Lysinibacillus irui]|uniref:Uncharacterized protein n=1 Tax=Lysinibacillus irui TaxID=2998077 RepID=A0AAJ5UV26_9BACI|nr:hypothetical protein [Lysinibacillus irui]WDV06732.1 hypothetical protein OU989_21305 [Lysinibacillus irui]